MRKPAVWTETRLALLRATYVQEVELRGRRGAVPRTAERITFANRSAVEHALHRLPDWQELRAQVDESPVAWHVSELTVLNDGSSGFNPDLLEPQTIEGRVTSLEELLTRCKVDLAVWEVKNHIVNTWEAFSNERGVIPLFQVKAWLVPRRQVILARELLSEQIEAMSQHSPSPVVSPPRPLKDTTKDTGDKLLEIAVFDPHIGMYGWGAEVVVDYDSKIAVRDYTEAVLQLAAVHQWYNVKRILFPVGNDLLHVDQTVEGRGGATTRGTQQDTDTRFKKMFTTTREAVVSAIDELRSIAPVDVLLVPGNHDEERVFMLGDVLQGWYRNDPEVTVDNTPRMRKYYRYNKVLLGFTHGMESKRQRDNLPLIMSTEAPSEMWANTKWREWHVGHRHTRFEIKWMPQFEERGIRVRSLPGLTPEDSWHYREGYKHQRSAEALVWDGERGFVGLHSFNL